MNVTNITNSTMLNASEEVLKQQIPLTSVSPHYTPLLPFFPDWITILLGACILLCIYIWILPTDMKGPVKKFIARFWFFILCGIFLLLCSRRWGDVADVPTRWPANMNYAWFCVMCAIAIYFIVLFLMYLQRYRTYHVIANNFSGSCAYYENRGDWTIFLIGTTGRTDRNIVIPYPIPQEIYVCPRCAWRQIGKQILIESKLFKVDIIDLPEEVKGFIDSHIFARMAKDKIYFGLWSQKVRASDPKYEDIEEKYNKANDRINELSDMLKGKLKNVKTFISDTFALQDKIKGKSWGGGQRQQSQTVEQ